MEFTYAQEIKRQSTVWLFQGVPYPTCARFLGKTGHGATVALEQRSIANLNQLVARSL